MGRSDERAMVDAAATELADLYLTAYDPSEIDDRVLGAIVFSYFDGGDVWQFLSTLVFIPWRKLEHCLATSELEYLWAMWDPPGFEVELDHHLPPLDFDSPPPALAAIHAHIVENEDSDAYSRVLAGAFALMSKAWGIVVVTDGLQDLPHGAVRDHVELAFGPAEAARWEAEDLLPRDRAGDRALVELDVLCVLRPSPDRVAAIFRTDQGPQIAGHLWDARAGVPLTQPLQIASDDPLIVGGLLPPGAVAVEVQDLYDRWHQAVAADGVWLALVPHPGMGITPPVRYADATGSPVEATHYDDPAATSEQAVIRIDLGAALRDGEGQLSEDDIAAGWSIGDPDPMVLEREVALRESGFALLWPRELPGPPEFVGWGGSRASSTLFLCLGDLQLTTAHPPIHGEANGLDLRRVLAMRLDDAFSEREAARLAIDAKPLPMRVEFPDGLASTSLFLAAGDRWIGRATHECSRLSIQIEGTGVPPATLTFQHRPDVV